MCRHGHSEDGCSGTLRILRIFKAGKVNVIIENLALQLQELSCVRPDSVDAPHVVPVSVSLWQAAGDFDGKAMADTALHNWPNADGDWRGHACSGLRLLRRGEGGVKNEEQELQELRVCVWPGSIRSTRPPGRS